MSASFVTSARIGTACNISAALYNFFSSRPVIATRVPASMRTLAIASPIPLLPPVMSAVAFRRFMLTSRFPLLEVSISAVRPSRSRRRRPRYWYPPAVELHHTSLVLNGKHNDTVIFREPQLFRRVRDQRTRPANLELFDFQVQIGRLPES